ncbi:MAG: hypothetical protein ABR607_05215 [Pyrinomonadaceae bacterium]
MRCLLFSRRYATHMRGERTPALKGRAKFIGRYAIIFSPVNQLAVQLG